MELDFYENYRTDYPNDSMFCLKHFSKEELIKLSLEIDNLTDKGLDINLSSLDYINNLSKRTLILKTGEENKGIIKIKENMYECILQKPHYNEIKEMLLSYETEETVTYNWLYDVVSETDFLLSDSGHW
jgi:hypothetical protein